MRETQGYRPQLEQTTLRLPPELKEQLQRIAKVRGDSLNETVIRLILAGMRQQSPRVPAHTPGQQT